MKVIEGHEQNHRSSETSTPKIKPHGVRPGWTGRSLIDGRKLISPPRVRFWNVRLVFNAGLHIALIMNQ